MKGTYSKYSLNIAICVCILFYFSGSGQNNSNSYLKGQAFYFYSKGWLESDPNDSIKKETKNLEKYNLFNKIIAGELPNQYDKSLINEAFEFRKTDSISFANHQVLNLSLTNILNGGAPQFLFFVSDNTMLFSEALIEENYNGDQQIFNIGYNADPKIYNYSFDKSSKIISLNIDIYTKDSKGKRNAVITFKIIKEDSQSIFITYQTTQYKK